RPAGSHLGARALRDARAPPRAGNARLGPLGAHDPTHAPSARAQRRANLRRDHRHHVTSIRTVRTMPTAKVHRISANAPDDVSGIESAIAAKRIDPAGIVAVFGKTEGNGLVNDFSRGLATQSLGLMLERHLPRERAAEVCLVMSGGTEGGMAPHWVVFERCEDSKGERPALALGQSHTAALPPEHLGRLGQVDQVAAGVRSAMAAANIESVSDV